jgi:putative spermidine/putrescine transport system ATP-binding protein
MALADLMVVMENGHIRQAAHPREVFERPVSPFIARFIGSHNVLRQRHGLVAVRADRCRLGTAEQGPHVHGRVAAVEYQGSTVRVALTIASGDEVSALVPTQAYYQKPVEPGQRATLVWTAEDTHNLVED